MTKWKIKKRKITIDQQIYIYSIKEFDDGIDILIYQKKPLMLRLRQSWIESWAINFYRPKVVELIIRYYQEKGIQSGLQLLRNEKKLFLQLTDLFFSENEKYEKELFIRRCKKNIN